MNILFAIDGSKFSQAAIDQALAMKCPAGTELKVVTVVDFSEPFPSVEGVKESEIEAARKLVADTVDKLKNSHPGAEVTGEVLDGYPVDEILDESRDWPAHLIVLGSHGRTPLAELLLGSVSRAVLLHATCAVRIVRTTGKDAGAAQNVILALNDSEHSKHLVDHALSLPWAEGTTFRCLHVVTELNVNALLDPDTGFATTLSHHYDEKLFTEKQWVHAVADGINEAFGAKVATAEVCLGEPREKLLEIAYQWPADLIMLDSHGRRGIEKLLMGSVSEAVATHAKCAVEVTRMPASKRQKLHIII
jgi:nucleotide-binding universal stress UspA family protein